MEEHNWKYQMLHTIWNPSRAVRGWWVQRLRDTSVNDDEEDDGKDFTMHVLYVNNGWAFDTYSSRQYPIEKLHEIYKAKIYKSFSFDEISNKSYEEFREEQEPELAKWSIDNDCSMFWKDDKEET